MTTRKQIAEAFRAARVISKEEMDAGCYGYICIALRRAATTKVISRHAARNATEVVMKRLGGCFSLGDWLRDFSRVPGAEITPAAVKAHRLAWLDRLIAEFES
jgi:hypothetical protein